MGSRLSAGGASGFLTEASMGNRNKVIQALYFTVQVIVIRIHGRPAD
jgi:hypothetical protein